MGRPRQGFFPRTRTRAEITAGASAMDMLPSQLADVVSGSVGRGADQPIARSVQEGRVVQRLPDVAFQPEGTGSSFFLRQNIPLCLNSLLNAPVGTFVDFIDYTTGQNRKLVLSDVNFLSSNIYGPSLFEGRIVIANVVKSLWLVFNRQCFCEFPYRIVVQERQRLQVQVAKRTDGRVWGQVDVLIRGWEVDDAYPQDSRGDK